MAELPCWGAVSAWLRRSASRVDALLTQERLRNYPLIFVVLGIGFLLVSTIQRLLDPLTFGTVLPDYLAHWTGGALLLDGFGADLYSIERQVGVQAPIAGTTSVVSWFVSPPLVAALYAPLALIGFTASAAVWSVINVALFAACVWSLRFVAPDLTARWGALVPLVLCASAPVFELLGGGQDSAFVLLIWLLAMRLITGRHQFVAGLIFGLALLKPQHVLLVPVVLLVTRRFGALLGFLVMGLVQAALSFVLVGPVGVGRWVDALGGSGFGEQVQQGQAWKMVSVPAFLHAVLPDTSPYALGTVLTIAVLMVAALFLVMQILRTQGVPAEYAVGNVHAMGTVRASGESIAMMATLSTTVVFSPHLVVYDAVLFFPVALFLLEHRPTMTVRLSLAAAFCITWLAPVLQVTAGRLPWPFSVGAAPWAAIPLMILWIESLRLFERSRVIEVRP